MESVVVNHGIRAGEAGVGIGSGLDGGGVAVEIAVGTCNTHTEVTGVLSGGNHEGSVEYVGVGAGAFTDVDDFVAVEGEVVVPVDPDDGAVGVASGVGEVEVDRLTNVGCTDHGVVVAIVGCRGGTLGVVDDLSTGAEGNQSDTRVVDRGRIGQAVASVERSRRTPVADIGGTALSLDIKVVLSLGSEAVDGCAVAGDVDGVHGIGIVAGAISKRIVADGEVSIPRDGSRGVGQQRSGNTGGGYAVGHGVDIDVVDKPVPSGAVGVVAESQTCIGRSVGIVDGLHIDAAEGVVGVGLDSDERGGIVNIGNIAYAEGTAAAAGIALRTHPEGHLQGIGSGVDRRQNHEVGGRAVEFE